MKYLGSKRRLAKYLLSILTKDLESYKAYVEPFVGGANMIQHIPNIIKRIGADKECNVIEALKVIRDNPTSLPSNITEEQYKEYMKQYKNGEINGIIGFVGVTCSFGAKLFGSFARDKTERNYALEGYNNAQKQSSYLKGIEFICSDYKDLEIPQKSIIYCDIPYKDTTKYKSKFNHEDFYKWAIEKHKEGHKVFISEYDMPEPFKCIWSKEHNVNVNNDSSHNQKRVEKIFTIL